MKLSSFLFVFLLTSMSIAQMNQTDSKGKKQGLWGKTYPKSSVYQYKGEFKDDRPIGIFTYFYPSNKVKAVIKHDPNGKRSLANYYHENGQIMSIGIYINNKKDSVWRNYTPNGRLSIMETFKADSLHGPKTIYYVPDNPDDKSLKIASVYTYNNGTVDGTFKEFFDDGSLKKSGQYLMGRKHGEWTTYSVSGKPMMLERFKNGIQHGWSIAYNESGNELNRVYFYNGKRTEGEALKKLMDQFKAKGISPNE